MSTKYQHGDAVPTEVLAKRLDELSDAVVSRMNRDNAKFKREFTCSIPVQLDRDADVVLSEAALRLSEFKKRIAVLEKEVEADNETIAHHYNLMSESDKRIAEFELWKKNAVKRMGGLSQGIEKRDKRIAEFKKTIKSLTEGVTHFHKSHGDINPLLTAYIKAKGGDV